jgi:hypothetical protein
MVQFCSFSQVASVKICFVLIAGRWFRLFLIVFGPWERVDLRMIFVQANQSWAYCVWFEQHTIANIRGLFSSEGTFNSYLSMRANEQACLIIFLKFDSIDCRTPFRSKQDLKSIESDHFCTWFGDYSSSWCARVYYLLILSRKSQSGWT